MRCLPLFSRPCCLACCLGLALLQIGFADPADKPTFSSPREALESFNELIGQWRGTGQLRRGSAQGAWRQNSEFVWDFSDDEPAVRYVVTDGKYATEGRITFDPGTKQFRMRLATPEGTERAFTGKWEKNQISFVSPADDNGEQYRLTMTALNEKRTLVLHEKTNGPGNVFFRQGEVGYTREGTRLAMAGGGRRECVVTGGAASTPVSYMGETYYVCCTGCKQAFDDDPAGIIADFKERLERRRQEFNDGK